MFAREHATEGTADPCGILCVKLRTFNMRPAAPNHAHDRYGSGGLRLTLYSWRPALRDLGLLAIFPLVLAFIDDNWAFTSSQTGLVDPWLYVARFLHPRSQALAFPLGYYGDRLSYIVPGWLWYQALGPLAGNYAFKLLDIYMAIGGLYFLVTALLTRRAALLCCALISVHPFFLMCFGWDYVDGAGVSFYTLSLLCCVLAAKSPKYRLRLFLAGALLVSLITTHFLWLNIAWTIPLGFLLRTAQSSGNHLLGSHG